jgi:hypothetical protein
MKKHTMDQRPKGKSQPGFPATSTEKPPAAHPGDGVAAAGSKEAGESPQTQRWLEEEPHQEYWNPESRGPF